MAEQQTYVIIGNGIAGTTAAEILRAEDAAAAIIVIADDPFPVYYRPALKDYLAGKVHENKLWARPNNFYLQQNIRLLSDRVVGVQAGRHSVQLNSGQEVGYTRLLLAQGARASKLTCPGVELDGVVGLRTVADYQAVRQRFTGVRRVVVSGSGTLALETIETLCHRGFNVVHLVRRHTLWSEVLDTTASDLVLQQERRNGVEVYQEEEIAEITGKQGKVNGIVTTHGKRIACEMVIMAIGIEPRIDFVKKSGVPCGRGIKVDAMMRTGAPDIYAAGDVLETTDELSGRTRVIGQWYPAIQQARAAAYSMLDLLDSGRPFHFAQFYNATFLYGLEFASVGLTQPPKDGKGYQEIIAEPRPRQYQKILLKDGVAVGVLALGERRRVLAVKRAIDHQVNLRPVIDQLFADDFDLRVWLDKEGVPPAILTVSRQGEAEVQRLAYSGIHDAPVLFKAATSMVARLVPVKTEDMPAAPLLQETLLSQTKVVTIGRQAGVYLLIDNPAISRRHAETTYANGSYILRDLGSANGTYINHVRLEAGSVHRLAQGDRVQFGKVALFRFELQAEGGEKVLERGRVLTTLHEMKTGFFDPEALKQALPLLGQPVLNADGSLSLPGATRAVAASEVAKFVTVPALIGVTQGIPTVFPLKRGKRLVLGRDKQCDIVLSDVLVSRKHAEIVEGADGFYIRDLGSSNGVIVNQARIDNPYLLVNGDRFTIGKTTFYFMSAGEATVAMELGEVEKGEPQGGKVCQQCGAANLSTARFCATCGTRL